MKQNDEFSFDCDGKIIHAKVIAVFKPKREIKLPRFYPIMDKDGEIYYFCRYDEDSMILAFFHAEDDSSIDEFEHVQIPVWKSDEILPCNGWFPHDGKSCPVSSGLYGETLLDDGAIHKGELVTFYWDNKYCREVGLSVITAFRVCGGQKLL